MGPFGIAAQIRPISRRRIDQARSSPGDGFAPGGDQGAHAPRHRIIGIGGEKLGVPVNGVALERDDVGVRGTELAEWPRADCGRFLH
jgi:hypothetical protein